MSNWPIVLVLVAALIASLSLVLRLARYGRRGGHASAPGEAKSSPDLILAEMMVGERVDDGPLRSRPNGRCVYGELQRRVAMPLKVESAGAYAERQGLSPDVRAFVTRAPSEQ